MSKHFAEVKKFYDAGVWSEEKVREAVAKNWITADEFKQITGKGILGE